jgi:hypothetical protein
MAFSCFALILLHFVASALGSNELASFLYNCRQEEAVVAKGEHAVDHSGLKNKHTEYWAQQHCLGQQLSIMADPCLCEERQRIRPEI